MFGNKEAQPTTQTPQAPAVKTDDMIVHVMPKEFLGKAALPLSAPVVAPVPKPVPPPVAAAPVVAPAPKPTVVQPPPPRKKFGLVIFLFLLLLMLAAGGAGAYYYYFLMPVPVVAPPTTPEPVPIPTPTPTPPPIPVPTEPEPGKDTDSDGLTDVEELLYGTDYRNPDTDVDTYLDGNEVFHRYHPNGSAPQTLLDTGAVRVFQSPEAPFTIYYPSTWTPVVTPAVTSTPPASATPEASSSSSVTFRSPSTASIVISTLTKDPTKNLEVWYQENVPNNNEQALEPSYTTQGLLALSKPGERIAYIDGGDKVFTLTYSLGDEDTIEFLTTFQMMLNSLTLLP